MRQRGPGLAALASAQAGCSSATDEDGLTQIHELYCEHSPKLVRRLTRATGCREVARDLTQDTFARLIRLAPDMLATIRHPEAYLRRVSNNLLLDYGRDRKLIERSKAALELATDTTFDQVTVLESRETLRRIEAAVARLKPKTRDIFIAHRLEGLSYSEIAKRTGLSVKGVEKHISKAIAKIDRMLDRG